MRKYTIFSILIVLSLLLGACAEATPKVVRETVEVKVESTKLVEATKLVETTKLVEATTIVEKEVLITPTPEPTLAPMFNESPMLAGKVKAGSLPPVEERLPASPRVVANLGKEPGVYGGELRFGFVGTSSTWGGLLFMAAWEHLTQWKADFSGVEPNLVESIDVSPDVKEYTFYMRKGMKWSDGEPFTADDIAFYIEDVLGDVDLNPNGVAADWIPAGQGPDLKFAKLDDYTFKITFPESYGTFLYVLAQWQGRQFAQFPKHYLMQFHKKYNRGVDELVQKEGVADWMALFKKYADGGWGDPEPYYLYPEKPSLYPWITTQPLGTGTQVKMARNPYYLKVDAQGNQLPYIDTILATSYQDAESRTFAMMNGDLDAIKDPGNENRIIYHDAMNEGKPISIYYPMSDGANTNTIHFNQTIADAYKAGVFADINFRIGMSYAINRQEIIEIVFDGQGTPAQQAPNNDGPLYTEGMDTQYAEYDVAKAQEYLDKVFTNGKDADGFYLNDKGKRFEMIFTVQNDLSYGTTYVQVAELLIGYWEKVGVKAVLNSIASDPYEQARKENTIECIIFTGEGGAGITPILDPRYYVPLYGYQGYFDRAWYAWRVNETDPATTVVQVEPPQWAKDAYAKYEEVLRQPTAEQQIEKMKIVLQEAKERFYVLGIARNAPMYYPYSSRLGGMPETWYDGWAEGVAKITYPEQWFIKP